MDLSCVKCPCCGNTTLRLGEFGDWCPEFPDYLVLCDSCNWICPIETNSDCGGALCDFFDWLSEFKKLGCPSHKLHENLLSFVVR